MRNYSFKLAAAGLLADCTARPASVAFDDAANDAAFLGWNFKVYLGDSAIGHHNFRLPREEDPKLLVREVNLKLKFLFVTAYRIQHENTETWQSDCLQQMMSRTETNHNVASVRGLRWPHGFPIDAIGQRKEVTGCVMVFGYWDPIFLDESASLNVQTGELTPVSVEPLAEENYWVRGQGV